MAEREGFEPSVPRLAAHAISSRAPSANSDISPDMLFCRSEPADHPTARSKYNDCPAVVPVRSGPMFLHHHAALGTFLVAHPPAYLVNQRAVDFLAERVGFEPTCMHYIRKKINAFSAPHVKPCMSLVILSKKCTTSGYKINFSVKKTKRTPVDLLTTDEFGYPTMTVAGKLSPGHPSIASTAPPR